jgi:hypothetical protein
MITPRPGDGPATGSVRPGSNICGAQLTDSMPGWLCRGWDDETGQLGKYPQDHPSQRDQATIMPRLVKGPATGSIRPGSNICGAQVMLE